jgi:FSR family fosmidomycin resistance protein-like MFS transporter
MTKTVSISQNSQSYAHTHQGFALSIMVALSFSHCMNDLIQSLIPSLYPIIKEQYHLDFTQIGIVTLAFQMTASLLQPLIGYITDKKPQPFSLPFGMGLTLCGLILIAFSKSYVFLLIAAALIGTGSSIFHPESARIARSASGGRLGLAQSLFQVGGNSGTAFGPLLAAFIVVPFGQKSIAWFAIIPFIAIIFLWTIANWYKKTGMERGKKVTDFVHERVSSQKVFWSLTILLVLVFSKHIYLASISSYYTFYLIEKFQVSVQEAQIYLFIFLVSAAAGTLIGGPIGDKIGRKAVIWVSILGVLPFTMMLPYVGLSATIILTIVIGFILSSAFSAILVFAQELVPGKVGTIAGLFFGLAFGVAGIAAAALGKCADLYGLEMIYKVCSYLPALGLLAAFLPNLGQKKSLKKA